MNDPRLARPNTIQFLSGKICQFHEDLPWKTVPGLLYELHQLQFSGAFALIASNVQTIIHFFNGNVAFVERGLPDHALGQLLLHQGTITRVQLEMALARMTQSIIENEGKRIGDCLIDLGILSSAGLAKALTDQLHEKLISCFRWKGPRFYLKEGNGGRGDFAQIRSGPLEQLILQGTKAYFDRQRLENMLLPFMNGYPYLTNQGRTRANCFELSSSELRFLMSLKGDRTFEAILLDCALPPSRTMQLLATLCFTRSVSFSATPLGERQPGGGDLGSFAQALSVEPFAEALSPDLSAESLRSDSREGREGLERTDASIPSQQTDPDPEVLAQRSFWEGKRLFDANKLDQALDQFRSAAKQDGSELKYKMFCVWTEYLLGGEAVTSGKLKSRLRDLARRVLSRDKYNAKAHLIIGHLHRVEQRVHEAQHHLQLAKQLDPKDPLARRELRSLMQMDSS